MENIIFVVFIVVFFVAIYFWYQWSKENKGDTTSFENEYDFADKKIKTPKKVKPIKETKKKPMKEKNNSSSFNFGKKKEKVVNEFLEDDEEWLKVEVKGRAKKSSTDEFSSFDDFDIKPEKKKYSKNDEFGDDDFEFDFEFGNDVEAPIKKNTNKSLELFNDGDLEELEGIFGKSKTVLQKNNEFEGLDDLIIKNDKKEPEKPDFDFDFDFDKGAKKDKKEVKEEVKEEEVNKDLGFLDGFDFESAERNLIAEDFFQDKKKVEPKQNPTVKKDSIDELDLDLGLFTKDDKKDDKKESNDLGTSFFAKSELKKEIKKESKSEFGLDLDIGIENDDDDDILTKIDKLYNSTKEQ